MDATEAPDLLDFVRGKLSEDGQSMTALAGATGISKRWLEMMRAGEIDKPGLQNLEALARHFGRRIVAAPLPPSEQQAA